jgi:hypothetical protein
MSQHWTIANSVSGDELWDAPAFRGQQLQEEDAANEAALHVLWALKRENLLTETETEALASFPPYPLLLDVKPTFETIWP